MKEKIQQETLQIQTKRQIGRLTSPLIKLQIIISMSNLNKKIA